MPEIWEETYDEAVVGDGEHVCLQGTVLGDVDVKAGAGFVHEGLIRGRLSAEAGAQVYIHGAVEGKLLADEGADVDLHGHGRMRPEWTEHRPFTGPEGWGAISAAWGQCVTAIDGVLALTSLAGWADRQVEDEPSTHEAFAFAAGAIALTETSDARLWALLSAAIFNEDADARVRGADERGLFSPHDCRTTLPWGELRSGLDASPPLFVKLLSVSPETGSPAEEYFEAIWAVMWTMAQTGDLPSAAAAAELTAYRTKVLAQLNSGGQGGTAPARPKPRAVRATPSTSTQTTATAGQPAQAPKRSRGEGPEVKLQGALDELEGLIGLDTVKTEVADLAYFTGVSAERREHGMKVPEITRHIVMVGNPGTGKTTVARLLGRIYYGYGLLRRPDLHDVDARDDLVGEYEGHTAPKVRKAFKKAMGGVLFIDEAYRLVDDNPNLGLGKEAISTLVPLLEDHRDDILVIVAGYPEPMKQLLRTNPGLKGRFGPTIRFPDYSDAELLEILQRKCTDEDFELTSEALAKCEVVVPRTRELLGDTFDNARCVRRLFETAVRRHHARVGRLKMALKRKADRAELRELIDTDIATAEELVPDAD